MAARLRGYHAEEVRAKIKTSQLINRLQNFGLTDLTETKPGLSDAQVRAILGLLKKTLPDLSNVELNGAGGGPLKVEIVRFTDPPAE